MPDTDRQTRLVLLAGPIAVWWNEGAWGSPAHQEYVKWRQDVHDALVAAGHLVYRPDMAWKGAWRPVAQAVNDTALVICDVVVNLTPPNTLSVGTDDEMVTAARNGKAVVPLPPSHAENALVEVVRAVETAQVEDSRLAKPVEVLVSEALLSSMINRLEDPMVSRETLLTIANELRTVLRDDRPVLAASEHKASQVGAVCQGCGIGHMRLAGLNLLCDSCGMFAQIAA